ncbi:MAG TPA: FG-GAP-like repeat-containing protein, partial [Williamwhitmania sp.]|nr:FG-GAP-like repeat-containing protein [Williamwhitmania sp.]
MTKISSILAAALLLTAGVMNAQTPTGLVGTIPGAFSVQPTGAATYQIPIDLPAGAGGLTPHLSLSYSSASGVGLAGRGWSLYGLSAITRVGQDMAHDGNITPLTFTAQDRLVLGGNRLVALSGAYLASSTVYGQERETFAKIETVLDNGTVWFRVTQKDGSVWEYGSDATSRFTPTGAAAPYQWWLRKVTDTDGNYYLIDYTTANSEIVPTKITYSKNTSTASDGITVTFTYSSLTFPPAVYLGGGAYIKPQAKTLTAITVSVGSSVQKSYTLSYDDAGTILARLTGVTLKLSDGSQLPVTSFAWENTSSDTSTTVTSLPAGGVPYYGDFEGDGTVEVAKASGTTVNFYRMVGSDFELLSSTATIMPGMVHLYTPDLDGDGRADLVEDYLDGTVLKTRIYQNTGSGFISKGDLVLTGYSSATPMQLGDINGDGKADMVWYDSTGKLNYWLFNSFDSLFSTKLISAGKSTYTLRDFNGDGVSDIFVTMRLGFAIYTCTGGSVTTLPMNTTLPMGASKFTPGDFNGDGLCDLLYFDSKSNLFKIALSNGVGFSGSLLVDVVLSPTFAAAYVADFDGDGADDIVFQDGITATKLTFFSPKDGNLIEMNVTPGTIYFDPSNLTDFDGDGVTELLYFTGTKMNVIKMSQTNLQPKITSFQRGDGLYYNVSYGRSTDGTLCSRTFNTTYPLENFSAPHYLVSSVTVPDGVGGTKSSTFAYGSPRVQLTGLGYLGFQTFEQTDHATGTHTTQTYEFQSPHYDPLLKARTVDVNGGPTLTETYTNSYINLSAGRYLCYPSNVVSTDQLKGVSTTISSRYDSNGNLTDETRTSGDFAVETTYSGFAGPVVPCFPSSMVTSYRKGGSTTRSATTSITYNTPSWKVHTHTTDVGTDAALTKTFTYGAFGNVASVAATGRGTTTFTYEGSGRFVTSTTNALGQADLSPVNTLTGTVIDYTDINGFKTIYNAYDALGRPTSITPPDKQAITIAYSWAVGEVPNAVWKVTTSRTGSGTTEEYHDLYGRTIQQNRPAPGGKTVVVRSTYNAQGELENQSLPGFTSPSSKVVFYTYDSYGRVASKTLPGKSYSYTYGNGSSKVTEMEIHSNHSVAVTYNELGLPASVDGTDGKVNYTYNGLGQPIDVTTNGGVNNHYVYNYQTSTRTVTNSNSGTSTVTTNAWGQPTSVTDARGKTTTITYDAMGRVTSKSLPEGNMTYHYDSQVKGALDNVSFGIQTRTFNYDIGNYGRLTSVEDEIDGQTFTHDITYDGSGRVLTLTYPNNFTVSYTYDGNSFTSSIISGGKAIWTRGTETALGQPVDYLLGNGVTTKYTYDNNHHIASITDGNIFSQSYVVNGATGNMECRTDNLRSGLKETFTYDVQNRLTSISPGSGATFRASSLSYLDNGNIARKSDAGSYSYQSLLPNAVTEIDPASGSALPTTPQKVTYSSYSQPVTIAVGTRQDSLVLSYGTDLQRVEEQTYSGGTLAETRYLVGDYEKVVKPGGGEKHYCYVSSPYGVVAVSITDGTTTTLHYLHTDYLGSVVAISNTSGVREQEMSYDAWGRRRNPGDWTYDSLPDPSTYLINRGYTFHEHYDKLGLINMNGRVYDPVVGRFLSVDPLVGNPLNSQDYNGYSYCGNNPLAFTDPSGYQK